MSLTQDSCGVLVVDDNRVVLELTESIITRLGYPCRVATDAYEALDIVADDHSIGIVLADIEMPDLDGLDLMHELKARFSARRALVTIIHSAYLNYETAMLAMRLGVFDALEKPAATRDIAAVLRRAQATWRQQASASRDMSKGDPAFIATDMNGLGAISQLPASKAVLPAQCGTELAAILRDIILRRRMRNEVIPSHLLHDPAWDMVLDMMLSKLEGQALSVSSVCMATSVPFTTAIRWLKNMETDNLVRRWTDPQDRRRDLVELTDACFERAQAYFQKHYLQPLDGPQP